ncbi:MAG: DUF2911 domain-containing protein [Gemmatimonadota bacterium]
MMVRLAGAVLVIAMVAACGPADEAEPMAEAPMDAAAPMTTADAGAADLACQPQGMPLPDRVSPYDSVTVSVAGEEAKVCYGRPSRNDREIFGSSIVPFDTIWRTGANEPTTIHIPFAAEIAGLQVEPGSYSIYTVPRQSGDWDVIVNRSTSQWGIETQYTDEIRAQEVGRAQVPSETVPEQVETFTISTEDTGPNSAELVLEWVNTRVRIPIERV